MNQKPAVLSWASVLCLSLKGTKCRNKPWPCSTSGSERQGLAGLHQGGHTTQVRGEEREKEGESEEGRGWESDRSRGERERERGSEHMRRIERGWGGPKPSLLWSWRWMCKDGPSLSTCHCRLCAGLLTVSFSAGRAAAFTSRVSAALFLLCLTSSTFMLCFVRSTFGMCVHPV